MPRTPTPTRRRPGRPAADSADLRLRLLDAAVLLFGSSGVAATPLSAIARKAKVTPALMHYYFGNKERLVEALVEERLMPLLGKIAVQLADHAGDPAAAIPAFVRVVIATLGQNPWLPPLWVREVLTEGGQLREHVLGRAVPLIAPRIRDLAAAAQKRGLLNQDLDPRLLMVSLMGLTVFAFASESIWRRVFGADDITPDDLTRHVLALLARGLELRHASSP
jgi:TetR/AcrR family transcriptional regulator